MSGPRRAVVTFALPDEGSAFTRMLSEPRRERGRLAPISGRLGPWQITVAFTGVGAGPDCERRLVEALRSEPELVISSGFAGALREGLAVGDLLVGENFSDADLSQFAAGVCGARREAIATQPMIAETPSAKAALAEQTRCSAVDMETAWIARTCSQAGIPLLSLRVVSDAADQAFPAPGEVLFDRKRQRPRYVRLPVWLLTHPRQIWPFIQFVRRLTPARKRAAEALRAFLTALPPSQRRSAAP